MYARNVQPNQPINIHGETYRCVDAGRTYVNVQTGLEKILGPLVEVEPISAVVEERMGTCDQCGETQPVSGLTRSTERYYDWDDPDEDRQGSVLLTRTVWTCRDQGECKRRRRGIAQAGQMVAESDDAQMREQGWGAIGGGR